LKKEKKKTGCNNGSQPMRVSEGYQASAPAYGQLCQRTKLQPRNPALAVAATVSGKLVEALNRISKLGKNEQKIHVIAIFH
jgi:hypothetical protein